MKPTTLVALVLLALGATCAIAGAANAWNHKALSDEKRASALVGGFSRSGARYYHNGLVYIRGNDIKVGSKTISDVVELGKRHPEAGGGLRKSQTVQATSASTSGASGPALLFLGIVGFIALVFGLTRTARSINTSTTIAELELARQSAIVPISVPGVLPHKGEQFYLSSDSDVAVIAEHHHAEYVGRYSGVSVRVSRGLSVRSGSSRGKRIESTTLDVDDRGTLYVSNQRVVFVGRRKTVDIPFGRIVGVESLANGMKINRSNASPLVLQTGSLREGVILQRILANDLQPPMPVASTPTVAVNPQGQER